MIRVCFVCMGNICRSPQAEGIFADLVRRAGLQDRIEIDSAGTGDWHVGSLADPRTREASLRHGIELTSRARHFRPEDLARFDWILVMDEANLGHVQHLAARGNVSADHVRLLRTLDPHADDHEVPDPYQGGANGFEDVFQMCRSACVALLARICQENGWPELRAEVVASGSSSSRN